MEDSVRRFVEECDNFQVCTLSSSEFAFSVRMEKKLRVSN